MWFEIAENAKPLVFEDIKIGEELPTIDFIPDEREQGRYLVALDEEYPWYYKYDPEAGWPIAHHAIFDDAPYTAAMLAYQFPAGELHAKSDTEFINQLPLGKPVKIFSKISDKYTKREREYLVMESLIVDQDGVEIERVRQYCVLPEKNEGKRLMEELKKKGETGLAVPPPAYRRFKKR